MRDFKASRLGVFSFTIPPFGVLLSYIFLKEALTPGIWISMLLVGIGVALVNSEKE
jgi:drug/metabolite transporter (DMT)-like permease